MLINSTLGQFKLFNIGQVLPIRQIVQISDSWTGMNNQFMIFKIEKPAKHMPNGFKFWWPGAESNRRHKDFQSSALPTELPGLEKIILT